MVRRPSDYCTPERIHPPRIEFIFQGHIDFPANDGGGGDNNNNNNNNNTAADVANVITP